MAPRLIRRAGERGWLALSPKTHTIQIGVTAINEEAARALLAQRLDAWVATLLVEVKKVPA
jgi:hypothetical protein